jgi:arylsulfatase A-like enzyme
VWLAVALGLASGLIEGLGHMALQFTDALENVWYQIIWIATLCNTLLLLGLGFAGAWLLAGRRHENARLHTAVIGAIVLVALTPVFALLLKEYLKTYAIAALLLGATVGLTRWIRAHDTASARIARASVPWLAALAVCAFVGIQGGLWMTERNATRALPSAAPAAPNVLVLLVDTLRSDHVSSYGYARQTTPNIDRLAKEGTLFEQAFAASSYTLPSHESLLTGLYPREHGVEWNNSHKPRSGAYPTLPETLLARGYRTAAFSGNTNYFTREHGFGRGFLHFEDFFHSVTDSVARTAYGRILTTKVLWRFGYRDILGRKRAEDSNRALLRWVEGDQTHPFFAFVNYMDTHDPYLPPPGFGHKFSTERPQGLVQQNLHIAHELSPQQLQSEIDAYDDTIAYVDERIGDLVATLQRRSADRPLLVVVTSDHGEEFYEHKGFLHGAHLYREVLQVPLIFWQPGKIPAGVRVAQPVSNTALPATVLEAVGGSDQRYPGLPLQSLWNRTVDPAQWPSPLAGLKHRPWAPANEPIRRGSMESIVSGSQHYIEQDGAAAQLFDMATDRSEHNNLAAQNPEAATALAAQLQTARARSTRSASQ